MLDIGIIKKDFPILSRVVNGKKLVYLDNAATTQKPKQVLDAVCDFYFNHNANIKRGHHTLSDEATSLYESSRKRVASFIGSPTPEQVIFTKSATDSLNKVAYGYGGAHLQEGDVVLTTFAEHNSSVLPWVNVCAQKGACLEYLSLDDSGFIQEEDLRKKLTDRVKVVVITHVSNVLGNITDIKSITKKAHDQGAIVVVDGSQAVPCIPVNMQTLGCDFYAFSAHKMLGTMGVGILYGKSDLLDKMSPLQYGGGMVLDVNLNDIELAKFPDKFEAGTPDVGGAVALSSAIDYLDKVGMELVLQHERALFSYLYEKILNIPNLAVVGPTDPNLKVGMLSFYIDKIHSHDVASILGEEGVAVRSGLHCAMNLHKQMYYPTTTRASFYIYNDFSDIDALIMGIERAVSILG